MQRSKLSLVLCLILGFIFITLGGFLLIFGAVMDVREMLYIALLLIGIAVVIYSILIILFIIYMAKRR